jgi:hypothetical protein
MSEAATKSKLESSPDHNYHFVDDVRGERYNDGINYNVDNNYWG